MTILPNTYTVLCTCCYCCCMFTLMLTLLCKALLYPRGNFVFSPLSSFIIYLFCYINMYTVIAVYFLCVAHFRVTKFMTKAFVLWRICMGIGINIHKCAVFSKSERKSDQRMFMKYAPMYSVHCVIYLHWKKDKHGKFCILYI